MLMLHPALYFSPKFPFLLLLLLLTCISQVAAAGGSPLPASAPHATVTCVHRVTDSVSSPITLIPRQRRSESETGSVAEVSGRGVNVAGPEAKQQQRRRRVRRAFPPTLLTSQPTLATHPLAAAHNWQRLGQVNREKT